MITVHWFVLLTLIISAFGNAAVVWFLRRLVRRAWIQGYSQGAMEQAAIDGKRYDAQVERLREQYYCSGYNDALDRRLFISYNGNSKAPMA